MGYERMAEYELRPVLGYEYVGNCNKRICEVMG